MDLSSVSSTKIIVIGNTKGGVGKSSVAILLSIALLYKGYKVALLDTDSKQGSSYKYINNRKNYISESSIDLPCPAFHLLSQEFDFLEINDNISETSEEKAFKKIIDGFVGFHFLIIDTPGNDCFVLRNSIKNANILISPVTESFFDISALFWKVFNEEKEEYIPSDYVKFIWNERKKKIVEKKNLSWVVMLNRVSNIQTSNKKITQSLVNEFSKTLGFSVIKGLYERNIFKELFEKGLTVLDLIYKLDHDPSIYGVVVEEVMQIGNDIIKIIDKTFHI
jgi:chromosome partitioning protein